MARADAPVTVNTLGLTFLGPTVMAIGSDAQKREIIKPMLHNEVIWCQGFSEPGAGSDLASLTTRATDAGDHWVVNGQKVWTTNALHADRMFGLVRTDPESQRHRGISMLLIDMHADGVDARPLKQMTGNEEFGEVFLTDVKVPKDAVLGEVGAGWNVAMLLLSFERGSSAIGQYTRFRAEWEAIAKVARETGRSKDPALRQRLADALVNLETLRLHSWHILTKVEQGEQLGFESSMTKLQWSETHQDLGEIYMDVVGYAGQEIPGPADRRARSADRALPVVAIGNHLGRLVAGAAQHRRRARARPPPLAPGRAAEGVRVFFALTDEQRALQESVREYLADRFPTSAVREVYDDPAGDGIPESLWQAFGEHGWLAVMVPEEADGLGLGVLDAAVLSRCLGRGRRARARGCPTVVAGEALRLGGGGLGRGRPSGWSASRPAR